MSLDLNRRGTSSASLSSSTRARTPSSTRPLRLSLPSLRTPPPSRVSISLVALLASLIHPILTRSLPPAAAGCLIQLILNEPSNNVKMIVLSRVSLLHSKHEHVLDDLVMDILRVLASPDMEVRRKALAIALEMVSSRNVVEVVGFLKKELVRTLDGQFEKVGFVFSWLEKWVGEIADPRHPAEPRVPSTPHPNDPHLRHQAFGSRLQRGARPHGIPRRRL